MQQLEEVTSTSEDRRSEDAASSDLDSDSDSQHCKRDDMEATVPFSNCSRRNGNPHWLPNEQRY
jgi:hypothetical protein